MRNQNLLLLFICCCLTIVTSCADDVDPTIDIDPIIDSSIILYEKSGVIDGEIRTAIYSMNSDGTDTSKFIAKDFDIVFSLGDFDHVSPTRSGLFTRNDGELHLFTTNDMSGKIFDNISSGAAWSPDGTKILFTKSAGSNSHDFYYYDLSDGTLVKIPGAVSTIANNDRISFIEYDWVDNEAFLGRFLDDDLSEGYFGLKNIKTGQITRLQIDIEQYSSIHLSTNRDRLVIVIPDANGIEAFYVSNVDGSNLRKFAEMNVRRVHGWSPNDDQILVTTISSSSPGSNVFSIHIDTGEILNLSQVPLGEKAWNPSWSPDGSQVVFSRNSAGRGYDIFRVDEDGSNLINLTNYEPPAGGHFHPIWVK